MNSVKISSNTAVNAIVSIDLIAQSLKFCESIKKLKYTVIVDKSQKLVIYVTVTSSSKVNSQDIEDPIIPQNVYSWTQA